MERASSISLRPLCVSPAQAVKLVSGEALQFSRALARGLRPGFLEPAYSTGIFKPGANYFIAGWAYLAFLLEFAKAVREGRADPTDASACKRLADEITSQRQHAKGARHFMLHVLFPDLFESIVSERHKRLILKEFRELAGGTEDLDDALLRIRQTLESQYGRKIGFYKDEEIKRRWLGDAEKEEPVEEDTGTGRPHQVQRYWVEKTIVRDRPDRQTGEYALGRALWSPKLDKAGIGQRESRGGT